jgi:hypothetical protein
MNELYGLPDLDDLDYMGDTTTPLTARADDGSVGMAYGFDTDWLTALLQRMQADGKILRGERIDFDTWSRVSEVLRQAVDEGYDGADAPDATEAFRDALHSSVDVFSAFKVHRMQHDMAAALTDENGDLKPFKQWLNDVLPIASHQVGTWLETEYNTAVIRAHQAADWQQFEAEKDTLPNLRWNPSTSANPGADHMPFWGVVRPVDDEFWSRHRPGDRWNCKCSLSSTDEPTTKLPEGFEAPENDPQPGLKDNPGKTGEVFGQDNNYVREAAPGAKQAVEKLMEEVGFTQDPVFKDRFLISNAADQSEIKDNTRAARSMLSSFPDMTMKIRQHVYAEGVKNPEYEVNGLIGDRKGIMSEDGISEGFRSAIKQGCQVVILDLDKHPERFKILRTIKISSALAFRTNDFLNDIIKECYIVFDNKAVRIGAECFSKDKENTKNNIRQALEKIKSDRSHS